MRRIRLSLRAVGRAAVTSLIDANSASRQPADEFSDTLKTTMLFGQYALNKYHARYYAKSRPSAARSAPPTTRC